MIAQPMLDGGAAHLVVLMGAGLLAAGFYLVGRSGQAEELAGRPAPGLRACGWAAIAAGGALLVGPLLRDAPVAAPEGVAIDTMGFVPAAGSAAPAQEEAPTTRLRRPALDLAAVEGPPSTAQTQSRRLSPREAERLRPGAVLRAWTAPGAPRWIALAPVEGQGAAVRAQVSVEAGGVVTAQVLDAALRSLGTFAVAPEGRGAWSFRPDGGEYFLVVSAAERESRVAIWLD